MEPFVHDGAPQDLRSVVQDAIDDSLAKDQAKCISGDILVTGTRSLSTAATETSKVSINHSLFVSGREPSDVANSEDLASDRPPLLAATEAPLTVPHDERISPTTGAAAPESPPQLAATEAPPAAEVRLVLRWPRARSGCRGMCRDSPLVPDLGLTAVVFLPQIELHGHDNFAVTSGGPHDYIRLNSRAGVVGCNRLGHTLELRTKSAAMERRRAKDLFQE